MIFLLLSFIFSGDVDLNCFKDKLFEFGFANPYTKIWEDPLVTVAKCANSEVPSKVKREKYGVEFSINEKTYHSFSVSLKVDSSTGICTSDIHLEHEIPSNWNFDSVKIVLPLYSPFDPKQYRETGEYSDSYSHPEIKEPCSVMTNVRTGTHPIYYYFAYCVYPKGSDNPCTAEGLTPARKK